uniref:Protease HtpX homolog n=1 Tax=uncultured Nocardioidaceae bacterium TaxID=253824 RepID=A0A6J4MLI6_9ACTN|nr:MAG: Probable protease htpX homolog 1 [uncultured Nocardioidaceae bacterium]
MAKTRFRSDGGLTARMGVVVLLLVVLYLAVGAALIVYIDSILIGAVVVVALAWAQWYFSDKLALASMRARVVTPEQAPELHGMIDRLVALADMPKPRVAIADTDLPNAFATGRSPDHAVVCVTTGILRRLDVDELEGVLSHELAHVAHRDVAVMTVASSLGLLAGFITRWGLYFGGGRERNNNGVPIWLVVWLVSILVYCISFVLTRALSRYRELSADRTGAYLTGKPSALASALTKISGDMARIPNRDLRAAGSMNAFFFAPAIRPDQFMTLFATHPPLDQRLATLAKVSADLGRPV